MTHNERVLELLSDGKPHSHHEIYGLFVVGHSRIADLRKRGHVIESWRDGDDYLYQLHKSAEPESSTAAGAGAPSPEPHPLAASQAAPSGSAEQLELIGRKLDRMNAQLDEMLAI